MNPTRITRTTAENPLPFAVSGYGIDPPDAAVVARVPTVQEPGERLYLS
jgi:hypothetical protein